MNDLKQLLKEITNEEDRYEDWEDEQLQDEGFTSDENFEGYMSGLGFAKTLIEEKIKAFGKFHDVKEYYKDKESE